MDYPGKVISKNAVVPSQTSASGVWTLDDAAAAVESNTWPIAGVPNPISRSLRFNSADSAYLNRTPGSAPTAATKGTWSFWIKRTKLATEMYVFGSRDGGNNGNTAIRFESGDTLRFLNNNGSGLTWNMITTQVFRDVGAWMSIVVALDTTQATDTNRIKIYVNGTQVTAFGTASYPAQNATMTRWAANGIPNYIGNEGTTLGGYGDYYLTETYYIDGQALTPSDFGLTDPQTGAWIPKKYTGTYGTNGFYLNFSNNASTAALGTDYSGNNNTWTTNNFSVTAGAGNDSMTDVPTPWWPYNTTGDVGGVVRGNYATLNPLDVRSGTFSNGNLNGTASAGDNGENVLVATVAMTSGKWYCEVLVGSGGAHMIGIADSSKALSTRSWQGANGWYYYINGQKYNSGSGTAYGATYTANDIIGVAYDADAGSLTFYKNGSSQGVAFNSGLVGKPMVFALGSGTNSFAQVFDCNFGQRPFAYTPPAGFLSLCTTNLPTPTILDGTDYFNTLLYNGSATSQNITGVGFSPDLVWIKTRSNAESHQLVDQVRGATKALMSNETSAETIWTNGLSAFLSDGFTLPGGNNRYSDTGYTYVAWNWKANGAGSTNTAGTITSTVSVNTTSGFSIVTYTGTGTNGATVGHGLGATPSMMIFKRRNSTGQWATYHASIGNTGALRLNATSATITDVSFWNNTSPTSTVFTIGVDGDVNTNTGTYVAYCFAAISGYSAFGSYTGNGNADGPFVYTGFRPAYVLIKSSSLTVGWVVLDAARDTYNVAFKRLNPNSSGSESTNVNAFDMLSNGFKLRTDDNAFNQNAATYIYMAFAQNPFKYSNAR